MGVAHRRQHGVARAGIQQRVAGNVQMAARRAPPTAGQAAMFAPDPPSWMVTVAGVSLPLARGAVAHATASVIMSLDASNHLHAAAVRLA